MNSEHRKINIPSNSLCYNIAKKKEFKNMSSIILSFNKDEAIMAADSRNTKLNGDFYDNYPKIYQVGNGLVGIAGINNFSAEKEIGEMYIGIEAYTETIKIAEKISIPEGYNTEFVVVRYKDKIDCKKIYVDSNNVITITTLSPDYHAFGVKHCLRTDRFDIQTLLSISTIRNLIMLDKEVEHKIRKTPTVGGPIQMYKISEKGIEDLSDKNAPRNFENYKKQFNSNI